MTTTLINTGGTLGQGIVDDVQRGATFQAYVGNTFYLTFSEALSGETYPPPPLFSNNCNVSWTVNASLDVGIAQPDIAVDSVKTTDSREAIVSYDINNPNLTSLTGPLYIQIYRSDQPTYQSEDQNNVAVGAKYQINLQPGNYTTNTQQYPPINLAAPAPGEAAIPVEPLAPDPSLPYVLAVVVNAEGQVPTGITIDESNAHFKIWVIADVTYGFSPTGAPQAWAQQMANALWGLGQRVPTIRLSHSTGITAHSLGQARQSPVGTGSTSKS